MPSFVGAAVWSCFERRTHAINPHSGPCEGWHVTYREAQTKYEAGCQAVAWNPLHSQGILVTPAHQRLHSIPPRSGLL